MSCLVMEKRKFLFGFLGIYFNVLEYQLFNLELFYLTQHLWSHIHIIALEISKVEHLIFSSFLNV